MPVQLIASKTFQRNLRKLAKPYPHIEQDLDTLIIRLENGETPGNQIKGQGFTAYKVNLKNQDANKGYKGGYRVIYYIKRQDCIVFVTIYAKVQQEDIPMKALKRLIEETVNERNLPC